MKLQIEKIGESTFGLWKVTFDDKCADSLGYDEMLGLVASITMPQERPCLQWLKTKEQHQAWRDALESRVEESNNEDK